MNKTKWNRILSLTLCIVLIAAMALFAAGCGDTTGNGESGESVVATDGQTLGEGAVSFPLTIVDGDGNEINVTINTDKKTVGEALQELGLVEGEESDYGLYIKTVNGICADYETDGTYWAFYIDGEYALTGVDVTDITEGSTYALKVEK